MDRDLQKHFGAVRALIFDLDGTLIDSARDLAISVSATLDWMKRPPIPDEIIYSYVGNGAKTLIRRALGPDSTEAECERGHDYFLAFYREHMLDNTVTYPGVREGLAAMAQFPMAVLTNKPVRFSEHIIEGLGLAPYFKFIYGGNSFEKKKPDPMGMQILLADLGVHAREAMMVGDSEVDVQTARNANTWVCGVTYGLGSDRLAEHPPDVLVDSLVELPPLLNGRPKSP